MDRWSTGVSESTMLALMILLVSAVGIEPTTY
jgi:hypothetical protein